MSNFNTSIKNSRIFDALLRHAETVTDCIDHKHAAAVVYKNKVVTLGKNQLKTHPMQMKYQTNSKKVNLHAEIDAITKAINLHGTDFLKKCDIYVLRLTGGGNIGMSKPCVGCQKAIDAFNFKRVFWT